MWWAWGDRRADRNSDLKTQLRMKLELLGQLASQGAPSVALSLPCISLECFKATSVQLLASPWSCLRCIFTAATRTTSALWETMTRSAPSAHLSSGVCLFSPKGARERCAFQCRQGLARGCFCVRFPQACCFFSPCLRPVLDPGVCWTSSAAWPLLLLSRTASSPSYGRQGTASRSWLST